MSSPQRATPYYYFSFGCVQPLCSAKKPYQYLIGRKQKVVIILFLYYYLLGPLARTKETEPSDDGQVYTYAQSTINHPFILSHDGSFLVERSIQGFLLFSLPSKSIPWQRRWEKKTDSIGFVLHHQQYHHQKQQKQQKQRYLDSFFFQKDDVFFVCSSSQKGRRW